VSNFKLLMRLTLGLWTIIIVLGLGIYYFRYISPPTSVPVAAESVAQAQQAGVDLLIHAAELSESVGRGNLKTVRRHAEHLVNLIEGESGEHYGDLDGDGSLEDPGDGVGLVNYLQSVASVSDDEQTKSLSTEILSLLQEIDNLVLSVLAANDLNSVSAPVEEVDSLAQRINRDDIAQLLAGGLDTVIVLIDNFAFGPGIVSVQQGSTVVWINKETAKHTATADNELFNSETLSVGESYSFTFNETGTFAYYCKFHGDAGGVGMVGQIKVEQ
jgi:plastocyanin